MRSDELNEWLESLKAEQSKVNYQYQMAAGEGRASASRLHECVLHYEKMIASVRLAIIKAKGV